MGGARASVCEFIQGVILRTRRFGIMVAYHQSRQSARTLHFTPDMILWECCEGASCDIWPDVRRPPDQFGKQYFRETIRRSDVSPPSPQTPPVSGRVGSWVSKMVKHAKGPFAREQQMTADPFPDNAVAYQKAWGGPMLPESKLGGLDDSIDTAMNNWYIHVVHPYSAARLTRAGDKLPAISGLAAAYRKFLGGAQYLAGHWSHTLVYTLAWRVSTAQSDTARTVGVNTARKNRRKPSWSWSSVDMPVWVPDALPSQGNRRPSIVWLATVMKVSIQLASSDPCGAVGSGLLRIQGPLRRMDSLLRLRIRRPTAIGPWAYQQVFCVREFGGSTAELVQITDARIPALEVIPHADRTSPSRYPSNLSAFYILPLYIDHSENDRRPNVPGLILQKSESNPESFVRVGMFRMHDFKRPVETEGIIAEERLGIEGTVKVFQGLGMQELDIY